MKGATVMQRVQMRSTIPGLDARHYPVAGRRDKVVITLSGSEGGLWLAKKQARWLQSQGIPALALGYFRTLHTGAALSLVPLEIIEQAIHFLQAQGYARIGILGFSKGAELALVAAPHYPALSCVVAKTPSWFVGEGLRGKAPAGTSSWRCQGQPLPYTAYRMRHFQVVRRIIQAEAYNILSLNTGKRVVPASELPVERINGPVLLLSTRSDTIWPSEDSGNILTLRLAQANFQHPYQHICYRYMSHFMLEQPIPGMRLMFRSERRYPAECASERQKMGHTVRDWLEEIW